MPVCLDHNVTTPFGSRAPETMLPHLAEYHDNPTSMHRNGRAPRTASDSPRQQLAGFVSVYPGMVIFMNAGAHAVNYAIKGAAARATQLYQWRRFAG